MKKTKVDILFDTLNYGILCLVLLIVIYPLYFTIIASISNPMLVAKGELTLLPKGINFDAYKNVFQNTIVWIGYRNTIFYTIFGTIFNLLLTIPCAYGLSKKGLPGGKTILWIFLFTNYFYGGLIPTYLVVKGLGMFDTVWVMVILGGISVYNLIITRTYYSTSIPEELYEAARIDGYSEFTIFIKIAVPLSAPIIAVMALFYGVGHWNDFFSALIYLNKENLYPLQLVLRNILLLNQQLNIDYNTISDAELESIANRAYMAEIMKYALVFIASFPLLCAYPFIQKYFVKGVMLGSIKG